MKKFIHTEALSITPLTPVHIGCGEDFEPTSYVIRERLLYYFDASSLQLPGPQREALLKAVRQGGTAALLAAQRFFHDHRDSLAGMAQGIVAVGAGVAEQYEARVGRVAQAEDGSINQLGIERTSHHPLTGQPYLPGSSLKGALRTGWLDSLNGGRPRGSDDRDAKAVEKRLLGGAFENDPFRLLGIADAAASSVLSKVVFSCNHKKQTPNKPGAQRTAAKGVSTRRQVVLGGQFRAFSSELRTYPLQDAVDAPPSVTGRRIKSFSDLAKACNAFYGRRMDEILSVLGARQLANPDWLTEFKSLLAQLRPALEAGEVLLFRVGRHSGAESVTPDGLREILIRGPRGQSPEYSKSGAKTIWLASDREDARSDMLPFGWVLIERTDANPAAGLEAWCTAERKRHGLDAATIEATRQELRAAALAERARQRATEEAAKARAAEEFAKEEERLRRLETASPQQQQILQFISRCEEKMALGQKDPFNPGSGLYQEASTLSRNALAEGSVWSAEELQELAAAFESFLPKVLRGYEAKAARKKLNLNALKGNP